MNIFIATDKITEAQVIDLITQALIKRREHDIRVDIRSEDTVYVHDGVHTTFTTHRVFVPIGDYIVHFYRYRQHSPCRGKTRYQINEPYGSNKDGIEVRVDNYWITVNY